MSKAEYPDDYAMALSDHATKAMLDRYVEGHEKRKALACEAGLTLKNVDFSEVDFETDLSDNLRKLIEISD